MMPSISAFEFKLLPFRSLFRATACLTILGVFGAVAPVKADNVFSSDFSKGSFASLGWVAKDGGWEIYDYQNDHPDLHTDPGLIARYGKNKNSSWLIKTFPAVSDPNSMVLTFDAGFGWGTANQGADTFAVLLLDDSGNGYIISIHRTKADWAAQWGVVSNYDVPKTLHWASSDIDATEKAVIDGGGLQTFTIKRQSNGGVWSVSGSGWGGATLDFQDSHTTTFSQVVLDGASNFDDLVFSKVSLDVTQ